jgi:hypothetical protein
MMDLEQLRASHDAARVTEADELRAEIVALRARAEMLEGQTRRAEMKARQYYRLLETICPACGDDEFKFEKFLYTKHAENMALKNSNAALMETAHALRAKINAWADLRDAIGHSVAVYGARGPLGDRLRLYMESVQALLAERDERR